MSKKVQVSKEIAGRTLTLTTGQLAKQASGSILLQYGDTSLFIASQTGPSRPGTDFFPLTIDYRERFAAAGKFPGGFLKREGRPTQREILTCRLTDRPLRPLFPKTFRDEVQVMINVMSCDGENDPDVWAITGGSAALGVAPLPFQGPIAGVRVGMIDDEFILFPTVEQMKESDLDLVMAGSKESVLMIEGFGDQIPEDQMVDALMFGHEAVIEICKMQSELFKKANIEPFEYEAPAENPWLSTVEKEFSGKIKEARQNTKKVERSAATKAVRDAAIEKYFPGEETELEDGRTLADLKEAFYQTDLKVCRSLTMSGKRLDGRGTDELRQIDCEVDLLPVVHGSALFTRGETQSLATVVLGTVRDEQRVDGLFDEINQSFYLHYNFPSFSVGECRPIRGPGRREIGHGALAERSVAPVLPKKEAFPYTIRIISDILESNGSSSMASVCSATLGLMAAGVPISQPVAGISVGVIKEGDDYVLLTDIIGDEDHFGDMDFKVAGSQKGITGIQLDLKIDGINEEIIRKTLEQAKIARRELLRTMLSTIRRPRPELPDSAPRIVTTKINPEKIGLVIGPSGKTIRAIQESTGAQIDIVDDGTITISGDNKEVCSGALAHIEALTEEIKVGRIYSGTVSSIKDFGAFVEIAPGKDGLLHISELSDGFVKSVADVVKVGEAIDVKVIAVDDQNRVKLSRKAVLAEQGLTDSEDESDDDDDDDYDGEEE
ncbi:polyribonucleotide nucleotidyltransferase [Thalassoglobus polymorphus]|uniref:Polyribonucleotide nucleotidyltransferase n=1 Tax=Thalassoglobus polymorphus TaxID=2527994 RepID=A0A517QJG9_9PLAN|nr:polyribonucleotide nucleotidyltransferase [Thalassoglobus polymorphus]QDT31768.1 Polyribonucleotide nucleotidyltransferase [Thalassoglobus polymorphus]